MTTALDACDDPDGQIPMPFPAAATYARRVMAWARATDVSHLQVRLGVPYGSHRLQQMDVFAPRGASDCAVLIFWHGGGWTNGYRQYVHFMAPHVCALGMVLVAPSYRLVTEAKMPAAFEDAARCLAQVRAMARDFGADPGRVLLSGHSAGGHLASLVALRPASAEQPQVQACLPISAIMDLHHPSPAPGSLESRVYEMVLQDPLHDAELSPIHWTARQNVPFDITLGEQDSERVQLSNRRMHALFRAQGLNAQLHVLPGHSHFDTHTALHAGSHPWYGRLKQHALA